MAEKNLPNLKAMIGLLIGGEHVETGEVIPKSAFTAKTDWQNLVFGFGDNPRMTETDEPVGKPSVEALKMPGKGTR